MYKRDLALNNIQGLICHKKQPTNQPLQFMEDLLNNFEENHHCTKNLTEINCIIFVVFLVTKTFRSIYSTAFFRCIFVWKIIFVI